VQKPFIIGIGGGTASGKTTLAKNLLRDAGDQATTLLRLDDYYRDRPELDFDARKRLNYDTPEAFDVDLIVKHLKALKSGHTIECPSYNFSTHARRSNTRLVKAQPVILLEGIMALAIAEIRCLIDFKIFVDTPADVRLLRRIKRDINERGRTLENVSEQYLATVRPMHDLYVEPSKIHADIIVPEGGHNPVALDLLISHIRKIIADNVT
jgi:uridine kinase